MAAPSLIATRRFSQPLRLRLQVLFAKAFESLADTYRTAGHRIRPPPPQPDERGRGARPLFPRGRRPARHGADGPRPGADRAGAHCGWDFPEPDTRAAGRWTQLRPDQVLETLRRRSQSQDEPSLDCRMAASVSDEAIAATHVAMALETVALLEGR